ncbi:hypothetical protein Cfor_11566, partial [Coptotermes formosanus]
MQLVPMEASRRSVTKLPLPSIYDVSARKQESKAVPRNQKRAAGTKKRKVKRKIRMRKKQLKGFKGFTKQTLEHWMQMRKQKRDDISQTRALFDVLKIMPMSAQQSRNLSSAVTNAITNYLKTGSLKTSEPHPLVDVTVQSPRRDRGKEFMNATFQNMLQREGIDFQICKNPDVKCSVVERVQRTIMGKLNKYFTYKNTFRFIDVLPKFIKGYNATVHSAIGMAPANVTNKDILTIWNTLSTKRYRTRSAIPKFHVGDPTIMTAFVSSEFDIFAAKPVQECVLETTEVVYKPIASVDQSDFEFLIPADNETYMDLDIKLYVRGKLTAKDETPLNNKDLTSVTNNFLHSLFIQCSVSLNRITITQASELCNYRSFLENILTYSNHAATTHLTNAFWYIDSGDTLPGDPSAEASNKGFATRLNLTKQSQEIKLYGKLHSDLCNVPQYLLPGVRLQIKFSKSKSTVYLMNTDAQSETRFKFLDAHLQ